MEEREMIHFDTPTNVSKRKKNKDSMLSDICLNCLFSVNTIILQKENKDFQIVTSRSEVLPSSLGLNP